MVTRMVQYSLQALSLCSCAVKQSPRPCCKSLMVIMAWNCTTRIELYNHIDNIVEANELINSLRLCDPAVGRVTFLCLLSMN